MGNILYRISRVIKDPEVRFYIWQRLGFLDQTPDDEFIKKEFKLRVGYDLNLSNPRTFNEKIQWLKINDRRPEYVNMVDKIKVKEIVKNKIGAEYVVPLLGSWDSAKEIDFELLPNRFVIKCNHNSGEGMCICRDKNGIDKKQVIKRLDKSLKRDYYLIHREWSYKDVERKVFAEELLSDENEDELMDYKLMCFNGKVRCSFVCSDRFSQNGLKVTFFDRDWKVMPFERKYPKSSIPINKPKNYELMVELAEKLSSGIKFVRVDFYEVNGMVYFGELTFYPGNGMERFMPIEWDYRLGEWLKL